MLRERGADVRRRAVAVVRQRLDEDRPRRRRRSPRTRPSRTRSRRRRRPSRGRSRARCCPSASSSSSPSRSRSAARGCSPDRPRPRAPRRSAPARASRRAAPRFLSAAPFLCLIELHLLCPDMRAPLLPSRGTSRGRACRRSAPDGTPRRARAPARASTGWPSCSARISTSGPASSIHGARMKTPRSGASSPSTSRSASKLCTCLPHAFRAHLDVDEPEVVRGRARSSPRTCRGSGRRTGAPPRRARRAASGA